MVSDKATEKALAERDLRHDIHLTWVGDCWHENPLGMLAQVIELSIPDDVAELFEVAMNLLEGLSIAVLLRDEPARANNDRREHTVEHFKKRLQRTHLPWIVQVDLTENDHRLLRLEHITLSQRHTRAGGGDGLCCQVLVQL